MAFSYRHPERLAGLAQQAGHGARAGTLAEAAQDAEVVLPAVNRPQVDRAIDELGERLAGKVVLDATDSMRWDQPVTPGEYVARRLPHPTVVVVTGHVSATGGFLLVGGRATNVFGRGATTAEE